MSLKEFEIPIKDQLIKVYNDLKKGKENQEKAYHLYNKYIPMYTLLDETLNRALNNLYPIAYPEAKMKKPTTQKIKSILEQLREI